MILYSINEYIKNAQRVEEGKLLKHFRLSQQGLEPMMAVLLKRGKIKKTINNRGEKLPSEIYYSWSENQQIPILSIV